MAEEIIRQIGEVEKRIAEYKERIEFLREMEKMLREEYRLAPPEMKMDIISQLRKVWGAIGANTRWLRYYEAKLEALKKLVPPIKYVELRITFSIETETGHEPIFCEVTIFTTVPYPLSKEQERNILYRIVNAALKFFYLHFDAYKDAGKKSFLGKVATQLMRKSLLKEEEIDDFITAIMRYGGLTRPKDEYLTYQAIIKIGVEKLYATETTLPKYPETRILIEKGRTEETTELVIDKTLIIAKETRIDLAEYFGIMHRWEK